MSFLLSVPFLPSDAGSTAYAIVILFVRLSIRLFVCHTHERIKRHNHIITFIDGR